MTNNDWLIADTAPWRVRWCGMLMWQMMWDTCRVERCGVWCDMLVWYFADVALYMSCWCDSTRGKICLINLVCGPLDYPYYPKPLDLFRFGNLPRDWITHTVRVRSNNYADLGRTDSARWRHASLPWCMSQSWPVVLTRLEPACLACHVPELLCAVQVADQVFSWPVVLTHASLKHNSSLNHHCHSRPCHPP